MDSLRIENHIADVLNAVPVPERYRRDSSIANIQVVHRLGIDKLISIDGIVGEGTPVEVARCFQKHREYKTDELMPYHFLVRKDGRVQQCLPLDLIGNGARRLNRNGLHIGVEGDFRTNKPTPQQAFSLTALCVALYLNGAKIITGHTEQRGCSADPDKVCPGKHLSTDGLRKGVRAEVRALGLNHAHKVGVIRSA